MCATYVWGVELGRYSPQRFLKLQEKPVSFGASEILMDAMSDCLVDGAVVVCKGAGTVWWRQGRMCCKP